MSLEKEIYRSINYKKFVEQKKKQKEIHIFDTLNIEQKQAVLSKRKNNLVIASAGTGKTSTIIARVISLIENGYKPQEIIMLTFTNKAGKEMLERLEKYFPESIVKDIFAGTFHSFGLNLVKKLDINKKLIMQTQVINIISIVYKNIKAKYNINDDEKYFFAQSTIYNWFSLYENKFFGKKTFKKYLFEFFSKKLQEAKVKENDLQIERYTVNIEKYIEIYNEIYYSFLNEKERLNVIDFNDLLKITIKYLQSCPAGNFEIKEIIVDEYQDTNNLQNSILYEMNKKGGNIFAVGDYDQSIYSFNGSDIKVIKEFEKKYNDVGVYTLIKNYRSTVSILKVANKAIEFNERIIPKQLEPTILKSVNEPICYVYNNEYLQYSYIVDMIKNDKERYDYNDVAVLFRSNPKMDILEVLLINDGIPVVRQKKSSFFESKEIEPLIALYDIAIKKDFDFNSFLLLKNFFNIDIEQYLLETFHEIKNIKEINANKTLFDILIDEKYIKIQKEIADIIKFLRTTKNISSPKTFFMLLYEETFFEQFKISRVNETKKRTSMDLDDIIKLLDKKFSLLIDISDGISFKEFNNKIRLAKLGNLSSEEDEKRGVKLLTVHASKGLEYKSVYIPNLVDGDFPNDRLSKEGGGVEEERRLFYVAVTRAKEKLVLSYYVRDSKNKTTKPSIFIKQSGIRKKEIL